MIQSASNLGFRVLVQAGSLSLRRFPVSVENQGLFRPFILNLRKGACLLISFKNSSWKNFQANPTSSRREIRFHSKLDRWCQKACSWECLQSLLSVNWLRFSESQMDFRLSEADDDQSRFRSPLRRAHQSLTLQQSYLKNLEPHRRLRKAYNSHDWKGLSLWRFSFQCQRFNLFANRYRGEESCMKLVFL